MDREVADRFEKFDQDGGLRQPPTANSSFSRNLSQGFQPWQQWLPVGGDCVAQKPNQRPAIVLGQLEGAFCRQRGHNTPSAASFGVTFISAIMT